jgi:glycosyl transferase family 2
MPQIHASPVSRVRAYPRFPMRKPLAGEAHGPNLLRAARVRQPSEAITSVLKAVNYREPVTTIAACLIVKDAAATLERCLRSVRPHVDEVVVYDTGSTDGTLELLDRLAGADGGGARLTVERGEWRDDFAWARERSFDLASAEWLIWLDADDVLVGGNALRQLVAEASPRFDGLVVSYDCERDESGYVTQHVWRVRVVRKSSGFRWQGLVHEGLFLSSGGSPRLEAVSADRLRVIHEPESHRGDAERNLRILRAAEATSPQLDSSILLNLGLELAKNGHFDEARARLEAHLETAVDWSDETVHAACLLAACLRMEGLSADAAKVELEAVERRPDWTEAALGLAESYAALGRWVEAQTWAERASELGVPQSPALVDPRWLRLAPLLRLAEASLVLGARERALDALEEARRRFGADEWLATTLDRAQGDDARAVDAARQALNRYDPLMRAAVRALWRETSTNWERKRD